MNVTFYESLGGGADFQMKFSLVHFRAERAKNGPKIVFFAIFGNFYYVFLELITNENHIIFGISAKTHI